MSFDREIVLTDRNRDERICRAEAFNTGKQTLILIRDTGLKKASGIVGACLCESVLVDIVTDTPPVVGQLLAI